jgi:hypothetical protein
MGCLLVEMRLEVVPLPVVDVDASKAFYVDKVGFVLDHDVSPGNGMRVVQLTPPGSACSIVFGTGMSDPSRSARVKNLHLGGGVKYAYFADPDDNSWALQEIPKR